MTVVTTVSSVLQQYEKNKSAASGNTNRVSNEDRLKRYFAPILPKGVESDERVIRILPTTDGGTPFVEVYFHEIQVDGEWVKLYDPKQDGERSPLNEVYQELMNTGLQSDKELARQYRAKKFFVVKLIERGKEEDGVKFWRFKYNYKGDGIFDKIYPLFQKKGDITDPLNGRDITLFLTLSKANNGKTYTSISSIIPEDVSPLSEDTDVANEWINDPLTWKDVYARKGEEYLDIVARGEVPVWHTESKKYVSKSESAEMDVSNVVKNAEVKTVITQDPQSDDVADNDDDLPF